MIADVKAASCPGEVNVTKALFFFFVLAHFLEVINNDVVELESFSFEISYEVKPVVGCAVRYCIWACGRYGNPCCFKGFSPFPFAADQRGGSFWLVS